jgi:hypothetical protein
MKKIQLLIGAAMLASVPVAQAAVTTYNVTQTFNQIVYDATGGWDTVFTGSFSFDNVTNTVSNLTGSMNQAMMDAMGMPTTVSLDYQLSSVYDATLGGLLVSSFHQNSTDVFLGGGFTTGGSTTFGNRNAYATIFVNLMDPTAALTTAQIGKLAYGDCTTGSLMMSGTKCMTGYINPTTGLAGGTMKGTYPISQTITAAVPEPETNAMLMAGLGLMGFISRRRRMV